MKHQLTLQSITPKILIRKLAPRKIKPNIIPHLQSKPQNIDFDGAIADADTRIDSQSELHFAVVVAVGYEMRVGIDASVAAGCGAGVRGRELGFYGHAAGGVDAGVGGGAGVGFGGGEEVAVFPAFDVGVGFGGHGCGFGFRGWGRGIGGIFGFMRCRW